MEFQKLRLQIQKFIIQTQKTYSIDALRSMDYELGVGQSGKGSVFGSTFITVIWWPQIFKERLYKFRLDEKHVNQYEKSQQKKVRKQIFDLINLLKGKILFYETIQITASQISSNMNNSKKRLNLNEMIYKAINQLTKVPYQQNFKCTHIYSKSFGSVEKEMTQLNENLQEFKSIVKKLSIEKKADSIHSSLSTANLLARILNQKKLEEWKFNEQMCNFSFDNLDFQGKFGSGGTSDPVTKRWLQENKHHIFGYPNIVRFSWSTIQNCLKNTLVMQVDDNEVYSKQFILKRNHLSNYDRSQRQQDLWDILPNNKK